MKKQQATVAATLLITSLSFTFCNTDLAIATGNRLQTSFFSSNSMDYFTRQIEDKGHLTMNEDPATSQIGQNDHSQPIMSRDLWTMTKELFYTLSDAVRLGSGDKIKGIKMSNNSE